MNDLARALHLDRQRQLFAGRPLARAAILILGIAAIVVWQHSFWEARGGLDRAHALTKGWGASHQQELVYYFATLGLYPVRSLNMQTDPSPEAARRLLQATADRVGDAFGWDRGGVVLLLPDFHLRDKVRPSFVTANAIGATLALIALFAAFWAVRLESFGAISVAVVGSNPFLLNESYNGDNIFGWTIVAGLAVIAIHVPLLAAHRFYFDARAGRFRRVYLWLMPVLTGLILGALATVRTEMAAGIGAAIVAYLLFRGFTWRRKAALIGLALVSYIGATSAINLYFDLVTQHTARVLKDVGASKVDWRWRDARGHPFWHPFWSGLGDFDGKYGYLWEDAAAFSFVYSKIDHYEDMPDLHLAYRPEFDRVLRDDVFAHIGEDPLWYIDILAKRFNAVLFENAPFRLAVGRHSLGAEWLDWALPGLTAIVLVLAVWARAWLVPGLMFFAGSAGAVAILITSGAGYKYLVVAHDFVFVAAAALILELLLWVRARSWTTRPS